MTAPLRFYSTNRAAPEVTLDQALLQGQASDRGLFLPKSFPPLDRSELVELKGHPYADVAHAVLRRYTNGVIDNGTIKSLCDDAYDFDVPLEPIADRRYLLRLDRGPTASFKDFAARMMARWMGVLLREQDGDLIILTATSGDTGSAVAHAYHGVDRIHVVVLFPPKEVSDRQRKQMTTIGENVTTIAIDGQFDDCQTLVKRAFADPQLGGLRLSSANSINIGRLLPQAVYYVYAYANSADVAAGEPIVLCVPSGNFGNMMGAMLAWRMGIPVQRLVVATNANDEFPVFLQTGRYGKIAPSRVCISNAMNVGHPSNLARLVDIYGGWMDETGTVRKPPDLDALRHDMYAASIDDEETRRTIRSVYDHYNVLLEPHGAVGWAGLERFWQDCPELANQLTVAAETAHPAKFPEEIRALLGIEPDVPPSLADLETRPEAFERLPMDYDRFRTFLLERFRSE